MTRASFVFLLLGCLELPQWTTARSWTVIDPFHTLTPVDKGPLDELLLEDDPFLFTMSPTMSPPSAAPSTSEPSESPTMKPTITAVPTVKPTRSPTGPPTPAPTDIPTATPTAAPTTPAPVVVPYYPPVLPPQNPGPGYFNYDYRSISKYGPGNPQLIHINSTTFEIQFRNNGWARVSPEHYNYWKEFGDNGFGPWKGILSKHRVEKNMCGNTGMQSPINLEVTPDSKCYETHQVRSRVSFASYDVVFRNKSVTRWQLTQSLFHLCSLVIYILLMTKKFRNRFKGTSFVCCMLVDLVAVVESQILL